MDGSIYLFFAYISELLCQHPSSAQLLKDPAYLRLEQYYHRYQTDSDESCHQPVQQTQIKYFGQQKNANDKQHSPEQLLCSGLPDETEHFVQEERNYCDIDDICYLYAQQNTGEIFYKVCHFLSVILIDCKVYFFSYSIGRKKPVIALLLRRLRLLLPQHL